MQAKKASYVAGIASYCFEMASPVQQPSLTVTIKGEEYSMLEQPSQNSALVLSLKNDLYDEFNLQDLVLYLKSVARFVRVTYYATGAAPAVKEVQEIRLDVFHLGNNISKLCDQSASTVASFRSTSRSVLEQLEAAYYYLTDNLEESAVSCLSTLSGKAEKMAIAAKKMKDKFEQQAKEVEKIADKTIKTQGEHDIKNEEMKKEQARLQEDRRLAEKLRDDFRRYEASSRTERLKYQAKEDSEIDKLDTRFWPTVGRLILGQSGLEKAEEYRKTKIKYLEEEIRNRQQRQEAMAKQAAALKKMEDCRFDEIKFTMVVEFLHHAVTALRGLAAIMEKAAYFWEKLQEHCTDLADNGLQEEIISRANNGANSTQTRQEHWKSVGFRRQAVTYFAKWVALRDLCSEYLGEIKLTQRELYVYITENPSREECRAKLRELCQGFDKDTDSARAGYEQLNSETLRRIEGLRSNVQQESV